MVDTPKHSVSVARIFVNNVGDVLIIQRRDNGQWTPPGGVLELDESFEAGVYKDITLGVVALVFRCRSLAEHAGTTDEAAAIRWAHPDEIAELMAPAFAVRITDALSNASAAVCVHDGVQLIDA
jgi:8-oxo-dGTP diphosphatase